MTRFLRLLLRCCSPIPTFVRNSELAPGRESDVVSDTSCQQNTPQHFLPPAQIARPRAENLGIEHKMQVTRSRMLQMPKNVSTELAAPILLDLAVHAALQQAQEPLYHDV